MGLKGYENALANLDEVALPSGMYNATKIAVGSDGIARFDGYRVEDYSTGATNQFIDMNEDNAITQTIKEVERRVLETISNHSLLPELLNKPEWDYGDRALWEKHLSAIVSAHHNEIIGLDEYRINDVTRVEDMSRLEEDLGETKDYKIEHDCETMSSLEGIMLSRIEERLLPPQSNDLDNLKRSGAYVFGSGAVQYDVNSSMGGHAFIISSLTGNIIEGTADPDNGTLPYSDTGKDYSYADFVAGQLATTRAVEFDPSDPSTMTFSIAVYGSYQGYGDQDIVDKRRQLIEEERFDELEDTLFDEDSYLDNADHFRSAFYEAGKVTFTVTKPVEEAMDNSSSDVQYPEGAKTYDDLIKEERYQPIDGYSGAFYEAVANTLQEHDFMDDGQPVILESRDGSSVLISTIGNGQPIIIDVTNEHVIDVPRLKMETEDRTTPSEGDVLDQNPDIECAPPKAPSFFEFVDGQGILNDDSGYTDADSLKDMIETAKAMGIDEKSYSHIENMISDDKFVSTAASIRAIKAAHDASEYAQMEQMGSEAMNRAAISAFLENISADDLIVDTQAVDDKVPYDKLELAEARELAKELDSLLAPPNLTCQVDMAQGLANGSEIQQDDDLTLASLTPHIVMSNEDADEAPQTSNGVNLGINYTV